MNRRKFLQNSSIGMLIATAPVVAANAEQTAGPPVVFWQADPVQPGETLLLFGDGLHNAQVLGTPLQNSAPGSPSLTSASPAPAAKGQALTVLQSSPQCLKVEIPANWRSGAYAVHIATASGEGHSVVINRAQLWWALGDGGASATPGSELRLFGKNFRLGALGKAFYGTASLRDAKGQWHALHVASGDAYSLTVTVPATAALGTAQVFVHNGSGGRSGWSSAVAVEIKAKEPWPAQVFNVRDFGAVGDSLHDDTPAVLAALDKCKENGGGSVLLPRGVYRVMSQLTIPPHTVVRGEKREVTWLFVPKEVSEFNTLLAGSGDFGVEDLSMVAQTPLRMITAPDVDSMYTEYKPWGSPGDAQAHDIFLRRLRIHHLRYAHRVGELGKDPRRAEESGPSTVALAGPRLEITDCEVVSPGMPIILHGTKHTRVLRNTFHTGRNGWYGFWGATETVVEENVFEGQDLEASYGGFANYGRGSGTDVSRLYIAHNRFLNGYGDEREAITFDTPGLYPWIGRVRQADGNSLSAAGVTWPDDSLKGLACLIVAGRGLGQHRRIVSNGAGSFTVDSPWDVVPDSSSVAAVRPYRRDVVLYRNQSQDTSVGIQLWSGGYNFIMDGNTSTRTGGLWGTAAQYDSPESKTSPHVFLPCYFTQWLDNEIREGFIYQQGPEADNSATLGLYARDVPSGPSAGVLIVGNVIRRNRVSDRTRIGLFYYGAEERRQVEQGGERPVPLGIDTVIEANTVNDSPVGIDVGPGFENTLVRHNTFVRVAQTIRQAS